jgi:hypothetical protein
VDALGDQLVPNIIGVLIGWMHPQLTILTPKKLRRQVDGLDPFFRAVLCHELVQAA